ncbi:MAG: T9SS type A sorting domain-containing protein [Candidatus Marinimicrobia bacterium]|nr:T9SS type A sorting domain-containing protein [Candidatus Neomarinimicrobiota bacterium]MCF7850316.1 T9SS type A sorting domain-containing protein [Candidatus Neomarinimicrobiota bacterium]MCF7903908.1 T9SS type A sorting domain-containing protein [Candidatus Neomarinimicrobiota bacterium]
MRLVHLSYFMILVCFQSICYGQLQVSHLLGRVRLEHLGTQDHCGFYPEFTLDLSNGDSLVVIEHDQMTDMTTCKCFFDLEFVFENPPPGDYTIHVFRRYSAPWMGDSLYYQGQVALSVSSDFTMDGRFHQQSQCHYSPTNALHYPLSAGNEWHYSGSWTPDDYNWGIQNTVHRVISDTLMPNGELYWRTEEIDLNDGSLERIYYQRYDEEDGIVYHYAPGACDNDERVEYNLNYSDDGEFRWTACGDSWRMINVYHDPEGGDPYLTSEYDGLIYQKHEFRDSIGLSSSLTSEITAYSEILKGCIIDGIVHGTLLSTDPGQITPASAFLLEAYPNPFNPSVTISYDLPEASRVELTVYDLQGKSVNTLVNTSQQSGHYDIQWQGFNNSGDLVGTGIYLLRIRSENKSETLKIALLR